MTPAQDRGTSLTRGRKIALGTGVVGVASLMTGALFGWQARTRWNEARATCDGGHDRCTTKGVELGNEARTTAHVSTAAFTVGIAATAAAVFLWYLTPPSAASRRPAAIKPAAIKPAIRPVIGSGMTGVGMTFHFP